MRRTLLSALALTVVTTVLASSASAQEAIGAWNAISEQAVKTANHPPPVAALDFAIVHLAIYDAVNSIDRRHEPYYSFVPDATGSTSAAAAKAAHDVLVGLFPGQSANLGNEYDQYLAINGISPTDPGIEVGALVAANMLQLRSTDGRFPVNPPPFLGNTAIGQWRPMPSLLAGPPPSLAPGLTPWVATVRPFAMESDSQFRVGPPPDLASDRWADDYNEVQAVGSLTSTTRTAAQTDMALFWADSGPILWQNALRYISQGYLKDNDESARMFALVETAMADAQIACWDSKYFYNFWRPVTAIRLGDQDGNPATVVDSGWQPLINTPNFPEYPSGHADISAAASRMLQLFFGTDERDFQMTTTNALAQKKTRSFTRFSQAEEEVVDARVLSGIHYRNSDMTAAAQGRRVAKWVFKHYLRQIGDN